jgi:hypothetical protein
MSPRMSKYFYEMTAEPLGNEWSSMAGYMFAYHPKLMLVTLNQIFDGDVKQLSAYLLGAAIALNLVEDHGIPLDVDEVLHGWEHDQRFDLYAAIRLAEEEE